MRARGPVTAAALAALLLGLRPPAAPGASPVRFGAELHELEWLVEHAPENLRLRRRLAAEYEARGLHENAFAQHLAVAARDPDDQECRDRLRALFAERPPAWLPEEGMGQLPFAAREITLPLPALREGEWASGCRLLLSAEPHAPPRGEAWDPLHGRQYLWAGYAWVWDEGLGRWVMRLQVLWETQERAETAQAALTVGAALYCAARRRLGVDPTRPHAQPVAVWLAEHGEAGARAVGRSFYLYAVGVPRAPAEWVRQLAHEYGHVALPGIGGFSGTDDPWADGHLGELLLPGYLGAAAGALPWSVAAWEREATAQRERLKGLWSEEALAALVRGEAGAEELLAGVGEESRDRFLGLALLVEEAAGPWALGEALGRCPRGSAPQFARVVREMGLLTLAEE